MDNFTLNNPNVLYCWKDSDDNIFTSPVTEDAAKLVSQAVKELHPDNDYALSEVRLAVVNSNHVDEHTFYWARGRALPDSDLHPENVKVMDKLSRWIELNVPKSSNAELTFGKGEYAGDSYLRFSLYVKNRWTSDTLGVIMPRSEFSKVKYEVNNNGCRHTYDFRGDWSKLYRHFITEISRFETMQQAEPMVSVCDCACNFRGAK